MSKRLNLTTVSEVKAILGITGSSEDTLLLRLINSAERLIQHYSGVTRFDRHTTINELITLSSRKFFYIKNIPYVRQTKLTDLEGVLFTDELTLSNYGGEFSRKIYSSTEIRKENYLIDYVAGYAVFDQIDVLDYSLMNGANIGFQTFSVIGGVDFVVETSNEKTAENIVNALLAKGANANSVDYDGSIVRALTTDALTVTGDGSLLVKPNVPEDLKVGVAMIAGAMRGAKSNLSGISAYKLGNKSVNYKSDKSFQEVDNLLEDFFYNYKNMIIEGV